MDGRNALLVKIGGSRSWWYAMLADYDGGGVLIAYD